MNYSVIFSTTPTHEEAKNIVRSLLEKKLVACVTILSQAESFFWWENKISKSSEYLLIIKTKKSLVKNVIEVITQTHSYDVPEVISLPIEDGNPDYLRWIESST